MAFSSTPRFTPKLKPCLCSHGHVLGSTVPNSSGLLKRPERPSPEQLQQQAQIQQSTTPAPKVQKPAMGMGTPVQRLPRANTSIASADSQIPQCVLGVDYGSKWTGLALGKAGRTQELEVLKVDPNNRGMFARTVLDTALQHQAGGVVVGLPLDPHNPRSSLVNDAADSEHATKCRWFANALALVARPHGIQVFLYDESGTSGEALRTAGWRGQDGLNGTRSTRERLVRESKKVDSLSAALLVQRFQARPGEAVRVRIRDADGR